MFAVTTVRACGHLDLYMVRVVLVRAELLDLILTR